MEIIVRKGFNGKLIYDSVKPGLDLHEAAKILFPEGTEYNIIDGGELPLDSEGGILFRDALTVDDAQLPFTVGEKIE